MIWYFNCLPVFNVVVGITIVFLENNPKQNNKLDTDSGSWLVAINQLKNVRNIVKYIFIMLFSKKSFYYVTV